MDKTLLGKRINTARKERGLTSERLSEACGINATYLRQIESGAKVPSLQVFVLLCQALRVSPTYLLADALPDLGLQDMDALLELCRTATPKQLTMITAMIRSALEASGERLPFTLLTTTKPAPRRRIPGSAGLVFYFNHAVNPRTPPPPVGRRSCGGWGGACWGRSPSEAAARSPAGASPRGG